MNKLVTTIIAQLPMASRRGWSNEHHNLTHPQRDWGGAVAVFLFTLLIAGFWSFYLYREATTEHSLESAATTAPAIFSSQQLTVALEALEARAVRYQAAQAQIVGTGSSPARASLTASSTLPLEEASSEDVESVAVPVPVPPDSLATSSDIVIPPPPPPAVSAPDSATASPAL